MVCFGRCSSIIFYECSRSKVPAEPLLLYCWRNYGCLPYGSLKARTVTETEIGLHVGDGSEKFSPNMLSRAIVKGSTKLVSVLGAIIPKLHKIKLLIVLKPNQNIPSSRAHEVPAFDLIRASVNLTVAGCTYFYCNFHETTTFNHLCDLYGCHGNVVI